MRQKIDYGIDLGTTNSAIARMDGGEATIIKSDDKQMDTTPSCVYFNKKETMFVGLSAKSEIDAEAAAAFKQRRQTANNGYLEFKRTMGTDHQYVSSFMQRSYSSEELSAEILAKLTGYIRDDKVSAVVITVPAMFKQNQIDATQRAAELAGIGYCELLQEPIAASIAYGIKASDKTGYWLVFDFGGGTFDAALMHVDDGIMKVVDTDGDNHLGGKNIDIAIVDQLFIPSIQKQCAVEHILQREQTKSLLQGALKEYAEQAKIALSSKPVWEYYLEDLGEDDNGEEIELDLKVSLAEYERVCSPIFQKAIDICNGLLKRNNLSGQDLGAVVLVGGPTFSQTLRRMLTEQVSTQIDTSIDPMTAVAKGAALFASTKDIPINLQKRDISKAQLTLKYPETTVDTAINLGIRVDRQKSTAALPDAFSIEVIRSDRGWSSGKLAMDGDADFVELHLNEGKTNQFDIKLFGSDGSLIPCEPNSITIIQGMKIANATLPYHVGLELYDTSSGKQGVYPIKGLEKNKSLPAKGKGTYTTAKDIRPANRNDQFVLQFYGIAHGHEGSRAIFNDPLGGTTITGEQLPALLPAGSAIDLTLSFDASRRATLSVYIPLLDETIEARWDSASVKSEDIASIRHDIEQARELVEQVSETGREDVLKYSQQIDDLERLLSQRTDSDTAIEVRDSLKKIFIALENMLEASQWPKREKELDEALENLVMTQERYGDSRSQQMVADYHKRVRQAKVQQDMISAKQLLDELFAFSFALVQQDIGLWISFIKEYDDDFDQHEWTDRREARRVINEAKLMIVDNPSKDQTENAVRRLWSLLPKGQGEAAQRINTNLLRQ